MTAPAEIQDADEVWFVKKPCKWCPYRRDVNLRFSPDRAADFAYAAENPYNDFVCHKTAEVDDDGDGDFIRGENSLTCAGFLSMQLNISGDEPPAGFEISPLAYEDCWEMIGQYEEWANER